MTAASSWINEDRVIAQVMPAIFQAGATVVAELVQNAWRAGADRVDITCHPTTQQDPNDSQYPNTPLEWMLRVCDNGGGIADCEGVRQMLTVGDSGFEQDADLAPTRPAGMGLYSLIAHARTVRIQSQFGRLTLDGPRWFAEPAYRDAFADRIEPVPCLHGLTVEASDLFHRKPETHNGLYRSQENMKDRRFLGLYARFMTVVVNGEPVQAFFPDGHFHYKVHVLGCDLWFGPRTDASRQAIQHLTVHTHPYGGSTEGTVIGWYNHPIAAHLPSGLCSFVDVVRGTPFTPKLPDRDAILKDSAWNRFTTTAHRALIDYVVARDWAGLAPDEAIRLYQILKKLDPSAIERHRVPYIEVNTVQPTDLYDQEDDAKMLTLGSQIIETDDLADRVFMLNTRILSTLEVKTEQDYPVGRPRNPLNINGEAALNYLVYCIQDHLTTSSCDHHLIIQEDDRAARLGVRPAPVEAWIRLPNDYDEPIDHEVLTADPQRSRLVLRWADQTEMAVPLRDMLLTSIAWWAFDQSEYILILGDRPDRTLQDFMNVIVREEEARDRGEVYHEVEEGVETVLARMRRIVNLSEKLNDLSAFLGPVRSIESIHFKPKPLPDENTPLDTRWWQYAIVELRAGVRDYDRKQLRAGVADFGGTLEERPNGTMQVVIKVE